MLACYRSQVWKRSSVTVVAGPWSICSPRLLPKRHRIASSRCTSSIVVRSQPFQQSPSGVTTATDRTNRQHHEEPEPPIVWKNLDVVVVGGGPAGLAAALALKTVRPDLNLKVFEASPGYTQQGAGVGVSVNGMRALEALDPLVLHRVMQEALFACASYQYNDETGERMPWVRGIDPRKALQTAFVGCLVPWNTLRTSLYASIPEGTVEFGCKVVDCVHTDSPAAAQSAPQEAASSTRSDEQRKPEDDTSKMYKLRIARTALVGGAAGTGPQEVLATARYVIAADGYFSKIRRTAGDGKTPAFTGTVRWLGSFTRADMGTVPLPAALTDPKSALGLHNWTQVARDRPLSGPPARGLIVHSAGAVQDGSAQMLVWNLWSSVQALEAAGEVFPMPPAAQATNGNSAGVTADRRQDGGDVRTSVHDSGSSAGGKDGARALQRALAVTTYLPADLRAMLAATPPERVLEFGLYIHPKETYQPGTWARGELLLLGDAAHATRPDGQGANQSFEDAAVLGALVRQHGLGPQTFALWEAARQPRARDILHDTSPDASVRAPLLLASSFEPLWHPADLAAAPGAPLPKEVAAEVRWALEEGAGGVDKAREAILAWSKAELQRVVEEKVAHRHIPETVLPPDGAYRFR